MNKKIVLLAGVAALALNVNAIVIPVPASGAVVNQHLTQPRHDKQVEQAPAQEDHANNVSVLWYIACIVGLLGILEAIEILVD